MEYKITFAGSVNLKELVIKYLSPEIKVLADNDFKNANVIYWIFGPGPDLIKFVTQWLNPKVIIIIHWIGSDVTYVSDKLYFGTLANKLYYRFWLWINTLKPIQKKVHHFCVSPWLRVELRKNGIRAKQLPLSSIDHNMLSQSSVTEDRIYDFIAYVPYAKFEFYGGSIIVKLAELMPEYRFVIIHSDLNEAQLTNIDIYPANITALPHIHDKLQILLCKSKCLFRLTEHDGLSLMVLEALFNKMQVIWIHEFPNVVKVDRENLSQVVLKARLIVENWCPNEQGHNYINENFSEYAMLKLYNKEINSIFCIEKTPD